MVIQQQWFAVEKLLSEEYVLSKFSKNWKQFLIYQSKTVEFLSPFRVFRTISVSTAKHLSFLSQ